MTGDTATPRRPSRRWLQVVVLVVGLAGLALVIPATSHKAGRGLLPDAPHLLLGAVFTVGSVLSAGQCWVALFDGEGDRTTLLAALYTSQLTKYVPVGGGVIQAASQVGLTVNDRTSTGRAALRFVVFLLVSAIAAAVSSGALVAVSGVSVPVKVAAGIAPLALVLLHRGLLARALSGARRVVKRVPTSDSLPSQRAILVSVAWAAVNLACIGAAYAVLLASLHTHASFAGAWAGMIASWLVGFVVIPAPSGLGIREAALVATIPAAGTAELLAASLALRIVTIVVEILAAGVIMGVQSRANRRRASPVGHT